MSEYLVASQSTQGKNEILHADQVVVFRDIVRSEELSYVASVPKQMIDINKNYKDLAAIKKGSISK